MLKIREAKISDLNEISKIYNWAILNTTATFDTIEKSFDEQKKWFKNHGQKNPILVAELSYGIIGWAALSKYSNRCAYSDTAELSLYVKDGHMNKGVGKKLMKNIIKSGRSVGLHVLIARITEGNDNSIHLHESFGFEHIGLMKEVGNKFGKRLNVYLMQKIY